MREGVGLSYSTSGFVSTRTRMLEATDLCVQAGANPWFQLVRACWRQRRCFGLMFHLSVSTRTRMLEATQEGKGRAVGAGFNSYAHAGGNLLQEKGKP